MTKTKSALRIAAQVLIAVFTLWSVGSMFFFSGSGNMRVNRSVIFRYFTVDSNLLCGASCLFSLVRSRGTAGRAAMLLRYAGTAAVTVTMLTVLFFLGPVYGYGSMFSGWNLWLHLLGPLLSIVSFVWLEGEAAPPEKKHLILVLLPVLLYGIVYYVMVIHLGKEKGGWPDFYGFNAGGRWYLAYAVMLLVTSLIGIALRRLRFLNNSPR